MLGGAEDALMSFAESIGAYVATSVPASGVAGTHPLGTSAYAEAVWRAA